MAVARDKAVIVCVNSDLVQDCAAPISDLLFVKDWQDVVAVQTIFHVVLKLDGTELPLLLVKGLEQVATATF